MLVSKKTTIYSHLVKIMNDHYSVSVIASIAQHYHNHGIRTDATTNLDPTMMYVHKMQWLDKPNFLPNEPDQVLNHKTSTASDKQATHGPSLYSQNQD